MNLKSNKPYNPFLITGYISPDYFCDRETETAKIISALKNDRNISLISPRRYGKTGLIHHVFYNINSEDKNVLCIYFDVFSTQNLNEFARLFAESILNRYEGGIEKAIRIFTSFFKSFRPSISYDAITGQPELTVNIIPETTEKSLQEVFSYLQSLNKRCYIAIDEFQQIANYPEKGTEALLRSYIQFLPNVKFIFSGSRQHIMNEIFLSVKRPFYQSTQIFQLKELEKDKYSSFVKHHFHNNGFVFKEECFDYLYDKFEGYTWYIQVILNRLYEYRLNVDNTALIDQALHELLEENAYTYQELLNAYSTVQRNLLKAVAKEKFVMQIHSGEFISKYRLKNASSINRALNSLLESELIYKSEKGYLVYDRFMGLWLSRLSY